MTGPYDRGGVGSIPASAIHSTGSSVLQQCMFVNNYDQMDWSYGTTYREIKGECVERYSGLESRDTVGSRSDLIPRTDARPVSVWRV